MQSSTPVQPVAPLFVFSTEIADTDHSIRFGGELDLGTEVQLREALADVDLTATTPLRLHLSELDFCDVNSLRHLLTFTRTVRDSGRAVEIEGARGVVRRLILLLGVESELSVA